ncbi:GMC family oxidoreductase [Actinomadura sp. 3N508]|uniref:GMC family oxidoreductase n=1 Tax=Actinomadura sp. 3N508 TaxID=3375153 RepID=UPI00378B46F7
MRATGRVRLAGADTPANRRRYERQRLGPLTSNVAEAVAFLSSTGGGAPDLELIWSPVAFTDDAPEGAPGLTVTVVLLQPRSRGRLTLAGADPASAPRIDPGYLTSEDDLATMVTGVRFARRLFETRALRPLVAGPMNAPASAVDDGAVAEAVRAHAQTMFHPVGTCRMGRAGDERATVDPRLRVRGVPGLRVADASVMPSITRGHTHAPAVMIGEYAADLVLQDAQRGN